MKITDLVGLAEHAADVQGVARRVRERLWVERGRAGLGPAPPSRPRQAGSRSALRLGTSSIGLLRSATEGLATRRASRRFGGGTSAPP